MAEFANTNPGAMTAVYCNQNTLLNLLEQLSNGLTIANFNAPEQIIVSGTIKQIQQLEVKLAASHIRFTRLSVATGFHSSLMTECVKPFSTFLKNIDLVAPTSLVYSTTTTECYPKEIPIIQAQLATQIVAPVKFSDTLANLNAAGVDIFVELGPNNVLTQLVKKNLPNAVAINMDHPQQHGLISFWKALGKLAVLGAPVNFAALWDEFAEVVNEQDTSHHSKAAVTLNGANYQKPYPNNINYTASVGEPNPVVQASESITANQLDPSSTDTSQTFTQTIQTEKLAKSTETTQMTQHDTAWLQAFYALQQNMINAQKLLMESLLQSHSEFMKVTDTAFAQLNGAELTPSSNQFSVSNNQATATLSTQVELPQFSTHTTHPEANSYAAVETTQLSELAGGLSQANQTPAAHTINPAENYVPPSAKQSTPTVENTAIDFKALLLQVVADKTGYPEEMLELDMELEAGLGIDSIKRVEIFSALQEKMPILAQADVEELTALNSLAEIVSYAQSKEDTQSVIVEEDASVKKLAVTD